jgi:hypothetical protein
MDVSPMTDEGRELAPGEYHFHATVTVPIGIPRFRYERDNCTATIKTFVKGILWTTDNPKRSKLSTGHFFDLVPSSKPVSPVAESNYEAISSCDVRLLDLLSAGCCKVGIRLDRPGFHVDRDTVVQITIHSTQPKTKIKSVSLSLVEEAQIVRKKKPTVTAVGSWEVPLDDNSALAAGTASTASDTTLAPVVTLRVDPRQVHKSVHLRLLIITHRLRVEIAFHGGASGTIDYPPIPLLRD